MIMTVLLTNLRYAVITGFLLTVVVLLLFLLQADFNGNTFWVFLLRWLHILCGVMWIGILWYFNFVQIPTMPKIPDELKPAIGRHIAPEALFWFRWAAMGTIVFGILLVAMKPEYTLFTAYTLGAMQGFNNPMVFMIGLGMWMGTIMWFNVWFIIWPNQQKALNIANAYPSLAPDERAKCGKTAGLLSRVNTVLSIPMLFCMAASPHLLQG
jgi:uncharacterized membrane protein